MRNIYFVLSLTYEIHIMNSYKSKIHWKFVSYKEVKYFRRFYIWACDFYCDKKFIYVYIVLSSGDFCQGVSHMLTPSIIIRPTIYWFLSQYFYYILLFIQFFCIQFQTVISIWNLWNSSICLLVWSSCDTYIVEYLHTLSIWIFK